MHVLRAFSNGSVGFRNAGQKSLHEALKMPKPRKKTRPSAHDSDGERRPEKERPKEQVEASRPARKGSEGHEELHVPRPHHPEAIRQEE